MEVSVGGRDPYCVFREQYCKTDRLAESKRVPSIREKWNPVEMSRLLLQLTEVSLCLQRTKQECELIEKRCGRDSEDRGKAEDSNSANSFGSTASKSSRRKFGHSISSSSYGSDSGKGSMVDYEALESVMESEERGDETNRGEPRETDFDVRGTEAVQDDEVERLLLIAQRLTEQVVQQQKKGKKHSYYLPQGNISVCMRGCLNRDVEDTEL